MSASIMNDPSHTFVCFECRRVYRRVMRAPGATDAVCGTCGNVCERLGFMHRVPKRKAKRAWKALELWYKHVLHPVRGILALEGLWEEYVKWCRRGK